MCTSNTDIRWIVGIVVGIGLGIAAMPLFAYPPGVGITSKSKTCLDCHANNGPWSDEAKTIIDILDKETGKSLRQANGAFVIEAKRGQMKTVVTVIGRTKDDPEPAPRRNAWLYIDPKQAQSE